ncbi:protogenin-like isoform X2 [Pomacea canaliculata]|uniref:protogenin-like isoform X2 n=1 Tax=Pomacea canaliculata TaxID=400727 RepID=UPI000D73B0AD|nr:protogenin-like isoform X2 [Pomacea canaliculata]
MAAVPIYLSILFAIAFASLIVQGDESEVPQPQLIIVPAQRHVIVEKRSPLLLNCSVQVVKPKDFGPLEFIWRKNGLTLEGKQDRRIEVFANGSLYLRRVVHRKRRANRLSDEGLYECVAGNKNGRVVARRVHVEVAGISRNFTQEPKAFEAFIGGTARFECSIQATPPAVIVWQKDNSQLPSNNDRFIQFPTGALQIQNVQASDAGMYRCMAAQNFNSLQDEVDNIKWKWSRQGTLTVNPSSTRRPIRMLVAPHNTTAMDGQTVMLECLADGNPMPTISWQRADKRPLMDRVRIVGQGSLVIENVRRTDEGMYHCHVTVGSKTLNASAHLEVQTLPVITDAPKSNRWPLARVVNLVCEVSGTPKPSISWYFNGVPVSRAGIGRYELKKDSQSLFMYNVDLINTGYYQCVVENPIGQVIALALVEVFFNKDAPQEPVDLTVTPLNSTSLLITWKQVHPVTPILTYVIHAFSLEDTTHPSQKFHHGTLEEQQSFNLTLLQPSTLYSIRVQAYNAKGASKLSEAVEARTEEDVPRGKPTFQLIPSADSLLVKWDEMPLAERRGVITKYRLQYRSSLQPSDITTHIINGSETSYTITGLKPDTQYEVRLLAATQKGFPPEDDWQWSFHKTLEASPIGQLPGLKIEVLNSSAVQVQWEALDLTSPDNIIDTIRLIELRLLNGQHSPILRVPVDPPAVFYVLGGLDNDTYYEVTVYASRKDVQVSHTFRILDGLLPPVPKDIQMHPNSPTSIILEWRPSALRDDITCYEVCYSLSSAPPSDIGKCISSDRPSVVISDLMPFTLYHFHIRINLQHQEGPFTTITGHTTEDKPGPPVNLTYGVVKPGSIRLQWSPPSRPNGIITSYVIFYNVDKDVPDTMWKNLTKTGKQTVAQVDDLDFDRYFFKMSACTKAGLGNPTKVIIVYPDCAPDSCKPGETEQKLLQLTDRQIGIIVGVSIGVACIIICIVVIVCRHRCLSISSMVDGSRACGEGAPVYHGNGHVPGGYGNGHANGPLASSQFLGLEMTALETMPMLTKLAENEQSDAKGGGDMIVTPSGVRINGFVKTNGQLPNGHLPHGHLDLSGTSEEQHSLIAAMIASANGNYTMDSRDVTLSSSNTNLDPEEDSLNDIDNSDADTDILAMGCDQLLSTVEGDLHAASQMSDTDDLDHKIGGTTQQSEAGAQTGHSRILTDREELAPPVDGGAVRLQDKVPARPLPVCLEVAAPGHNALWGGGSVGGEEDCWQKQGYCQQEQYDQQSTTAAPTTPTCISGNQVCHCHHYIPGGQLPHSTTVRAITTSPPVCPHPNLHPLHHCLCHL